MIQALEGHLAAWAQRTIQGLSTESDLFGHVRPVAGRLTLAPGPPLGQTEVAALVQLGLLRPRPEDRDLGPRPAPEGSGLQLTAQIHLRLLGRVAPYSPELELTIRPSAAVVHRVDLAALTLLALLKERPGPAADGPVPSLVELEQGVQPPGAVTAAHGARRASLAWTGWEVGEVSLTPSNPEQLRQWDIGLTATCDFRLSPAALEGGRILQIGGALSVQNKPLKLLSASVYGQAESLPLGWFDGLSDSVIAELADQALETLGDLGRLGPTRIGALATALRTATPAEESLLGDLATMAAARQTGLELTPLYRQDPLAFALPARALLAPSEEEGEILARFIPSPEVHAQVAMLALPVTQALRPERREQVALGTLLSRGR